MATIFDTIRFLTKGAVARTAQIVDIFKNAQLVPVGSGYFAKIGKFIDQTKLLAANGLTIEEVGQIIDAFKALAVEAAADLDKTGEQKKQIVLQSAKELLDMLEPFLPIPWWVKLAFDWKAFAITILSGGIEQAYQLFKARKQATTP